MATINITPFTDVLLVLLIIFIILAAVTKEPRLPDAHNKDHVLPSQIVVIVNDKNSVQIGSHEVSIDDAPQAFTDLQNQTGHRFRSVIVKADPASDYGTLVKLMDAAKQAGLADFGLANHVQGTPQGASQ